MADNVSDEKIWANTNSNMTHYHAFTAQNVELRAMCRTNIRPAEGITQDRLCSKSDRRKAWQLPSTFCDGCWAKVTAMVDRRNASMEPAQERHDAGYVAPVDDREETAAGEEPEDRASTATRGVYTHSFGPDGRALCNRGYVAPVDDREETAAGEEPEDWASTATRGMYTHRFGPDGRALCNRRYRAYDRFVSDTDRRVRRTRSEIENGKYGHLYTFCPACSAIPWGIGQTPQHMAEVDVVPVDDREEQPAEGPVESPVREGQEFVHVEDGSRAVVTRVTDSLGSAEPIVWCILSRESQEHRAQIPRTIFLSSYRPLSEENHQ